MLELKTYTTKELCDALSVKENSFKTHKRKILKEYDFSEEKIGRCKVYHIHSYKRKEKSEFIKLCEQIASKTVNFPKENTAKKFLKVLFSDDFTILDNEELGFQVPGGMERHTVKKYLDLFREYNILPKKKPLFPRMAFDSKTGEILSRYYDPNKYTYYKVHRGSDFREEIERDEYFEMQSYIQEKYSEYLEDFLECANSIQKSNDENVVKYYNNEASKFARFECVDFYGGLPRKAFSKVPTEQAYHLIKQILDK